MFNTPSNLNPIAQVASASELGTLAAEINREHAVCEAALGKGLEHARAVGTLLLRAKKQCGHGAWEQWVKKNCTFGPRQATNYMRLATKWHELQAAQIGTGGSDLGINRALATLAVDPPQVENRGTSAILPEVRAELGEHQRPQPDDLREHLPRGRRLTGAARDLGGELTISVELVPVVLDGTRYWFFSLVRLGTDDAEAFDTIRPVRERYLVHYLNTALALLDRSITSNEGHVQDRLGAAGLTEPLDAESEDEEDALEPEDGDEARDTGECGDSWDDIFLRMEREHLSPRFEPGWTPELEVEGEPFKWESRHHPFLTTDQWLRAAVNT